MSRERVAFSEPPRSTVLDRVVMSKTEAIDTNDFQRYQIDIIHDWLYTVTRLVIFLVPLFFVLDLFIVPNELLSRFALYRIASTVIVLFQYLIVRNSDPSRFSYVHGYIVSIQLGGFIALMTTHLGGFNSGYYAGLIMVIIGVNLLMPWKGTHTAANSLIILSLYVGLNLHGDMKIDYAIAANNLFFLCGSAIISVAISHVRYRLIEAEFSLLVQLKDARDALWGEMELAKEVQVALLPDMTDITGYEIAVSYDPAREVGGDYYDVIQTREGDRFLTIGDVSGHGLDSGLIMMMAQTGVITMLHHKERCTPIQILETVNRVLRENIRRLKSSHYMTMTVIKLEDDHLTAAGHHQDILVYRSDRKEVDVCMVTGSWLGIADSLEGFLDSITIPLSRGDCVLLFSDGITEATSETGEMYGQTRLVNALERYAGADLESSLSSIIKEIQNFQATQTDDMTLIMLKRL